MIIKHAYPPPVFRPIWIVLSEGELDRNFKTAAKVGNEENGRYRIPFTKHDLYWKYLPDDKGELVIHCKVVDLDEVIIPPEEYKIVQMDKSKNHVEVNLAEELEKFYLKYIHKTDK